MEDIYLTQKGYEKLTENLEYLKQVKRKRISESLREASALGDLSENAEYTAAKEAQELNERKIAELEEKLSCARIIENEDIAADEVRVGAAVRLKDLDSGKELEYTIVCAVEADYDKGKISIASPVGKNLLGHKEQDTMEIKIPAGILRYKILKISR